MKIHRSIVEPLRLDPDWEERWRDVTQGLITSWERGREKSIEDPLLASKALKGELPLLPWKGGFPPPKVVLGKPVVKKQAQGKKYGVFNYLAMWQGLRGEDLIIDVSKDLELTCTLIKKTVIFTNTYSKYANSFESEE